MNYFVLFGIPQTFKVNKKLLVRNFYKLQLQFHPDFFINSSKLERDAVLKKSIEINKGYNILKDSFDRAIYLLSLENIKINQEKLSLKNKDVLTKYFSLYEEIGYLKKHQFNEKETNVFLCKIKKKINYYETQAEQAFEEKNFKKIMKIIENLLFFKKIRMNFKKEQDIYLRSTD